MKGVPVASRLDFFEKSYRQLVVGFPEVFRLEPFSAEMSKGFMLLEDRLQVTGPGMRRNGVALLPESAHGLLLNDELHFEGVGGIFVDTLAFSNRAAIPQPTTPESFLVLKDALLEEGHPLGERLSPQRTRLITEHGCVSAELTYGWITTLQVRPFAAIPSGGFDWRVALLLWLARPEAAFLRRVFVDIAELEPQWNDSQTEACATALATFAWPSSLESLSIGCRPQKKPSEYPSFVRFLGGFSARLALVKMAHGVGIDGVAEASPFELQPNSRLSWSPNGTRLHLTQSPYFDRWPSWDFVWSDERWRLSWRHGMPRSSEVKVSGLEFSHLALLPEDEIQVEPGVTLRFGTGP